MTTRIQGGGERSREDGSWTPVGDGARLHLTVGIVALAALVGVLGGWAATTELAGAVIAPGTVVVDSNVRKVQHPTGGVVGELRVRDGDPVKAGDVVVRLDETQTRAALGIVVAQLYELTGRKARLEAEFAGSATIIFPPQLTVLGEEAQRIIGGEHRLFDVRRQQRAPQTDQLKARIAQLEKEIEGLTVQHNAKGEELELIRLETDRVAGLFDKQLIPETRMLSIRRERSRIGGEHGALLAQIARARGQISEIELQILGLDQTLRSEAQRELRDVEGRIAELLERRIAAEDQLQRVEIRAPIDGIVHQLTIHTVGGVISPSEPLMLVVPQGDTLVIEAKVAPQDIDNVRIGQAAYVRFPAFNQRTTPEFLGEVRIVAADLIREPNTGLSYFLTRLSLSDAESERMGDMKLKPGMPAEVQIRTGEATFLSYLVKPLSDHFARAFKER